MMELSEKAKAIRNEYYRRWRAANPDKVRETNRRYWEKKAERAEDDGHCMPNNDE